MTLPSDGLIPFSRITQKVVQARLAVDTLINGPSMILHATDRTTMLPQFVHSQCFARQTALPRVPSPSPILMTSAIPKACLRNNLSTAEYVQ